MNLILSFRVLPYQVRFTQKGNFKATLKAAYQRAAGHTEYVPKSLGRAKPIGLKIIV